MKKIISTLGIIILFSPIFCEIIINEYSASNLTGYTDNYDMEEDWIELYNTSNENVDAGGYYLSDEADEPTKWMIPFGTTIPGNGYKTFWCSGRDEGALNSIHTSFKLKQTEEEPEHVVLSDSNGNIINDFEIQITQLEHSMGRSSDGAATWKIFPNPTKNQSNENTSYQSYAEQPEMSSPAGFYEGGLLLEILTAEPDAEIYYTIDGTLPNSESSIYPGPLWVTSTQVVKAIVIPNEYFTGGDIYPSFVTFNTYFVNENHHLPVLSTSANQLTNLLNGNQSLKPHGTIEYFNSDGIRTDFGYGEYNKHGQDSWAFPQRSYDYIARDEMGYHDAIHEKLLTLSDREEFQRIIIRASGDDNYPGIDSSAHMRDLIVQKTASKHNMNLDMRRGERVVAYVNGIFWGVYSIREKVSDSDYTNFYYDQDKYNIQYVMNWGNTWAQYGGDDAISDWNTISNYADNNDLSIQSHYEYVTSEIDITSLVDYILINSFVVCTDWINWNTSVWRGLDPNGSHQKWGFVLWDEDATFNHYINYTGIPNDGPDAEPCYPEEISAYDPLSIIDLLNELLENEEFARYYNTRYMDLMNTAFKEEEMINLVEEIENSISFDMNHHFLRWGGYPIQWHNNVNNIKDFISDRIDYIPEGMNSCYDLTGPFSLTLDVYPQDAGKIQINSIEIESSDYPWTGDYHGEIEMIIKATQENNFNHWEINNHEIIDLNAANISLMLTEDDTLRAVFNEQNTSDILVINEFMADNESIIADEAGDYEDWIELYYNIPYSMNLDGYFLTDNLNNPSKWMFPDVEIQGEGYVFIWADEDQEEGYLHTNFKLSNSGEEIGFFDPDLNMIDQISFGNQSDDISYGRVTDGSYSWEFFNEPTPNFSNSGNPCDTGDINCDNGVDVLDVILMINFIFEDQYESAADLNNDGVLNILDVVQLVYIILNY
jgi:hypothetical protein